VIHGVQHVMHPPCGSTPGPMPTIAPRIVIITRDLEPHYGPAFLMRFSAPRSQIKPDRAALVDNPLIPFGGMDR